MDLLGLSIDTIGVVAGGLPISTVCINVSMYFEFARVPSRVVFLCWFSPLVLAWINERYVRSSITVD